MTANDSAQPEKTRLSAKQQQAALCLARGTTIAKTAKECGCADITIERWKRLPHFMTAVHQAEDDLYNEQLRVIKKAAGGAIACLMRNMDGKVSPYVQVQAAGKLLDLGLQIHKSQEIEDRLAALEAYVNGSTSPQDGAPHAS